MSHSVDNDALDLVTVILHPWLDGTQHCPWQAGFCPNLHRSRAAAGQVVAALDARRPEVPMPDAPTFAPRLTNACESCGDCYHPVIGPDADGDPCPWCRDCGCHADEHTSMACVIPSGKTDA